MSDLHSINEAINKRAGRKLLPSIAVSLSLIVLIWALLSFFRFGIAIVVAVAVSLAIKELASAFSTTDTYVSYRSLLISTIGLSAATWFGGIRALAVGAAIALGLILIGLLRKGPKGFVKSASASIFALVYLPFLMSFAILLARPASGFGNVMTLIVLVSCNDTFGYLVGVLIGKHPMAPHISPKKSWEGLAGSIIFTAIGGNKRYRLLLEVLPLDQLAIVGVILLAECESKEFECHDEMFCGVS